MPTWKKILLRNSEIPQTHVITQSFNLTIRNEFISRSSFQEQSSQSRKHIKLRNLKAVKKSLQKWNLEGNFPSKIVWKVETEEEEQEEEEKLDFNAKEADGSAAIWFIGEKIDAKGFIEIQL